MKIDRETLANLPENDILSDVMRVEGEEKSDENEDVDIDTGPVHFEDEVVAK